MSTPTGTAGGTASASGTGTTPGGTTPTSVPSFTPRTSQRSNTAAATIRQRVKQEDCASLSTKAYDPLQSAAVESLTSKFDLMSTNAENNDEKLTGTYTLNMVLQQLIRKSKIYDLQRAFILIQPDLTTTYGSVLSDVVALLEDYDKQNLQQYVVERSVEHMRKWGEDYDIENLEWSQELLENSCSEELRNLVSEQMLEIDTIYHGGPLFFYLMMKIIIRTTNEATRKLIERIRNLNISNIRGENILQVTSLIRGAVTRLGNKVPSDITDIVLKVYQTTSYEKFNRLFEQMEVNMKINTGSKYTLPEITSVANSNYQEMLDTDVWQHPGLDNAFQCGNKNNNNNKKNNKKGKNRRGGGTDGNKKTHKKNIPPKQGESHTRMWNDITLHWCPKCGAWRKHTPSQHVDQEEYIRCRRESEQSKATKTPTNSQTGTVSTETNNSSTTDQSSVTFASSFRRWKD